MYRSSSGSLAEHAREPDSDLEILEGPSFSRDPDDADEGRMGNSSHEPLAGEEHAMEQPQVNSDHERPEVHDAGPSSSDTRTVTRPVRLYSLESTLTEDRFAVQQRIADECLE
ncbi:hypothetical protein IMSHALPRED_006029 [Imshaugia aleurites]|uniref:Uncharacterized protein n=1 Tax=Imshaugia aleurites TaxID=172621 RepID=A0A8H3IK39_9LECA|nr:hypothetical protein IMSHALPRED_006029 [Imshaugia aleurites]